MICKRCGGYADHTTDAHDAHRRLAADDLRPRLDPAKALEEAQEIAREVSGLIAEQKTPNFVEVARLCDLVLEFTRVETRVR